jgi:DNA-binding response OmpR family regulator
MSGEARAERWRRAWAERRRRCLERELPGLPDALDAEARAIVEEARRIVEVDDPAFHAGLDVRDVVDRVNALAGDAPVLLHRPVCNALTALRNAAQELLAARAGAAALPRLDAGRGGARGVAPDPGGGPGCSRFLVVGDDPELRELVAECERDLAIPHPTRAEATLESALEALGEPAAGAVLVVVNLTLDSAAGRGPHGLQVAREARRRRHHALLLTAAGDYLHYWPRLGAAGLTGHDVIVKTRRDFADRLRDRIREMARPAPVGLSFVADTDHVVRIGEVEVTELEAQEAITLRCLDGSWRTAGAIVDRCRRSDLCPERRNIPPLISALRHKLRAALMQAESDLAQRALIENRVRDSVGAEYRLAPWLRWVEAPARTGPARTLPPLLVIEDEPHWAGWVVGCLEELGWPAAVAASAAEARAAMDSRAAPVLVVDLGLPDPATGRPDHREGVRLIEELAAARPGLRVVVLSVHGHRDSLRSRLFEAGVPAIDVLDKSAPLEERRAVLLAALQRAADGMQRGVRRVQQPAPVHRVERAEDGALVIDGCPISTLSPREAAVLGVLIARANEPVPAAHLEALCYPERSPWEEGGRNRVHQTLKRLRRKIDHDVGRPGVAAAVLRTPHRGTHTTYELHGVITNRYQGPG